MESREWYRNTNIVEDVSVRKSLVWARLARRKEWLLRITVLAEENRYWGNQD